MYVKLLIKQTQPGAESGHFTEGTARVAPETIPIVDTIRVTFIILIKEGSVSLIFFCFSGLTYLPTTYQDNVKKLSIK